MRVLYTPSTRSGFSLVELMLVILILALLAGILVPVLYNELSDAADARRGNDIKTVQAALESYFRVHGSYPDTGDVWRGDAPNYGGFGYDAAGYIPGLVPDVLPTLPKDPSNAFPDAADGGYMYRSNGTDYKFVVYLSPETFPAGNPFYDPTRPNTGWQISSPGGYSW